jgi:hypothetical protein
MVPSAGALKSPFPDEVFYAIGSRDGAVVSQQIVPESLAVILIRD